MSSFLDNSGMIYLVDKMKTWFNNRLQTEKLTPTDGVYINNKTIGLNNPVKGIYNEESFNVLSEEEKIKGCYFINDGLSNCGSEWQIYDEQERVIGTWFGKLLYRKVLMNLTSPSETNIWTMAHSLIPYASVMKINAYAEISGSLMPYNLIFDTGYSVVRYVADSSSNSSYNGKTGVLFYSTSSEGLNLPVTVILEYTKKSESVLTALSLQQSEPQADPDSFNFPNILYAPASSASVSFNKVPASSSSATIASANFDVLIKKEDED